MNDIIFYVGEDIDWGYTAKAINHSIFTEGDTIEQLKSNILDAINCHFETSDKPKIVRLHFVHQELFWMHFQAIRRILILSIIPLPIPTLRGSLPKRRKGGGNKIQHMDWFELLKESWKEYNVEYQNSWLIGKILEKLNRDMFWNDQLNSLIAMANDIDIGIDKSVEMARKARQGRLGEMTIKELKETKIPLGVGKFEISLWDIVKSEAFSKFTFNFYQGANLPEGMTQEEAIRMFFNGIADEVIHEIAKGDLRYVINFGSTDLVTNRLNYTNGTNHNAVMGSSSPIINGSSEIWISTEMFWDKKDRANFFDKLHELSDVFHHEWGHSWLKFSFPEYENFHENVKEVMADEIADTFRINRGQNPINRNKYRRLHGLSGYPFYKNKEDEWNPFRRLK